MAVFALTPFNDANGDGLDDRSGLPRAEHEAQRGDSGVGVQAGGGLQTTIADNDGDGRDDSTGLTQEDLDRALGALGFNDFSDTDGDGLDDRSGLDREEFRVTEHTRRANSSPTDRYFRDEDGDGRDDRTLLDRAQHERVAARADVESRDSRVSADRARASDSSIAATNRQRQAAEAAAEAEAQRQADAAAYEEEYRRYVESGERREDLMAGRPARPAPGEPGAPGYVDPYAVGPGEDDPEWVRELDAATGDIWFVNTLTGARQREEEREDARRDAERRAAVAEAERYLPSAQDVTVEYGLLDDSALAQAEADPESIAAQRRALAQLEEIYGGEGLTAADRGRLQQGEREMARAMRSQREADMAALRARGLGGSGAQVQSMLSAQQSGADMLADREADIQYQAQQRALNALTGAGNVAGQMRGSSWDEASTRASAMDEWNKYNTQARDKSAESAAAALGQQFQNRAQVAGMKEGVYTGEQQTAQANRTQARADEEKMAGTLQGFIEGLKKIGG